MQISPQKIYCFVDLDNTIVRGQTQIAFLKYLVAKKKKGYLFLLSCLFIFLLYNLGIVKDISKIRKRAYALFAGISTEEMQQHIDIFFEEKIKPNIFLGMQEIIKGHREKRHKLVIISAAFEEIVKKVAGYFGIEDYIATKIEIEDSLYTDKIIDYPIYGHHKILALRDKYNDIDYKNSYAYADHISDKDFLELFGNPIVVNGGQLINSYAIKNGWKIYDFR